MLFFADIPPAKYVIEQTAIQKPALISTHDLTLIKDLLDRLDPETTLVLWDVDQTLYTPDDAILKPHHEKRFDELLGGSKIVIDSEGKKRYLFREIVSNASHSLVDPRSVQIIKELQNRNMPNLAITLSNSGRIGKIESFIDWRIEELRNFGFDFRIDYPSLILPKDRDKEYPPVFKSGVLMTSLHDKGIVLKNFLAAIGWKPKKIVFIDDQLKNIQSVIQELGDEIEIHGFHYTAASEKPCLLNEEAAQFQVEHFKKTAIWLSDAEALSLVPLLNKD